MTVRVHLKRLTFSFCEAYAWSSINVTDCDGFKEFTYQNFMNSKVLFQCTKHKNWRRTIRIDKNYQIHIMSFRFCQNTSLVLKLTKQYPRGCPSKGPDLWNRKSNCLTLPNFSNNFTRWYLPKGRIVCYCRTLSLMAHFSYMIQAKFYHVFPKRTGTKAGFCYYNLKKLLYESN